VWIIGTEPTPGGYSVSHFDGVDFDRVSGGGIAVSAGPDSNPWLVNSSGAIFRGSAAGLNRTPCPSWGPRTDVPESSTGVSPLNLMPGEAVTLYPRTDTIIPAFGWPETGPAGYTQNATSAFPLPGAPRFSLLVDSGSGWNYLGASATRVTNTSGVTRPLRFRTNDDLPGGGSKKFVVDIGLTCRS
jgi:hypothetical protein